MRTFGLFVLMFIAACSSSSSPATPDARVDGSTTPDASVDGSTTPDASVDAGDRVACSAQTSPRPSYLCGTCATDALIAPKCVDGALTCAKEIETTLVRCDCGPSGLNGGCCDSCGTRVGSLFCATSGSWECAEGTTACGLTPKACVDGGSDASDGQ